MNPYVATMLIAAFGAAIIFVAGGLSFVYAYRKGVQDEADAVAQYEQEKQGTFNPVVTEPAVAPFTPPRTKWYITRHAVHVNSCHHLPHLLDSGKASPWPWPDNEEQARKMADEQGLRICRTCLPFGTDDKEQTWSKEMNDHDAPSLSTN